MPKGQVHRRKPDYVNYNDLDVTCAIEEVCDAVRTGLVPNLAQAAKQYGIRYGTLRNHISHSHNQQCKHIMTRRLCQMAPKTSNLPLPTHLPLMAHYHLPSSLLPAPHVLNRMHTLLNNAITLTNSCLVPILHFIIQIPLHPHILNRKPTLLTRNIIIILLLLRHHIPSPSFH